MTAFPIEDAGVISEWFNNNRAHLWCRRTVGHDHFVSDRKTFDDDDLVLAEYSATVVGMQFLYQKSRNIEEDVRSATAVQMAINTLSYSELKAVQAIFEALEGDEGRLTASSIADRIGITRSVIVNALRKLESAGIIESRSLGMKGTYLKVLNSRFKEELNKHQY